MLVINWGENYALFFHAFFLDMIFVRVSVEYKQGLEM